MTFVYAYFFSDFLHFDMSLLLWTVTLGVSDKHCLLFLFSFLQGMLLFFTFKTVDINANCFSTCTFKKVAVIHCT